MTAIDTMDPVTAERVTVTRSFVRVLAVRGSFLRGETSGFGSRDGGGVRGCL